MIRINKHTEGDTRVAKGIPSIRDFAKANDDHLSDVRELGDWFAKTLKNNIMHHDWTKRQEPYKSMFYRDLCATIEGRMNFMDGEWAKLHYTELERHHLKRHCPDDVNMFDVIEMICDCTAAGMARSGDVYDIDIPAEVLTKAVKNTVELLKEQIEVVKKEEN